LVERPFEGCLERHRSGWAAAGNRESAANAPAAPTPPAFAALPKPPRDLYFPSSASIPAVNIMSAEPPVQKKSAEKPSDAVAGGASKVLSRNPPQARNQHSSQRARQALAHPRRPCNLCPPSNSQAQAPGPSDEPSPGGLLESTVTANTFIAPTGRQAGLRRWASGVLLRKPCERLRRQREHARNRPHRRSLLNYKVRLTRYRRPAL
jgi:hypothetical protein